MDIMKASADTTNSSGLFSEFSLPIVDYLHLTFLQHIIMMDWRSLLLLEHDIKYQDIRRDANFEQQVGVMISVTPPSHLVHHVTKAPGRGPEPIKASNHDISQGTYSNSTKFHDPEKSNSMTFRASL